MMHCFLFMSILDKAKQDNVQQAEDVSINWLCHTNTAIGRVIPHKVKRLQGGLPFGKSALSFFLFYGYG